MMSAEDIAATKVAVELCNSSNLKSEILCAPGSDFTIRKDNYNIDCRQILWYENVQSIAEELLKKLNLSEQLQQKITGAVISVGMRMLIWAVYHERLLQISRQYSLNFMNSSLFSTSGIIDSKKAAEELMKDETLSVKQKYKLACLYCLVEHIPALHNQMKIRENRAFYDAKKPKKIKQPEIIKFWSYYFLGEVDKLRNEEDLDVYRLKAAIASGCKAAVEFCLDATNMMYQGNAIVNAAEETMRNRILKGVFNMYTISEVVENDLIIFRDHSDSDIKIWTPSDYYIDILCFLLDRMKENQLIEFLKKDIVGANYKKHFLFNDQYSRVLEYLINWPYQNYFMRVIKLMWEFLPVENFAFMLLNISHKIEPSVELLKYGEQMYYDYRKLLHALWSAGSERFKRYVLSDKDIIYPDGYRDTLREGKILICRLFKLKKFTFQDKENIELILGDATDEQKQNIICSKIGGEICTFLMQNRMWEMLDMFVRNSFPTRELILRFKKEFSFSEVAQHVCIDFVKDNEYAAAELFLKWTDLPENEIVELKKQMIYSDYGQKVYVSLVLFHKIEVYHEFVQWFFSSREEIRVFDDQLSFNFKEVYHNEMRRFCNNWIRQ